MFIIQNNVTIMDSSKMHSCLYNFYKLTSTLAEMTSEHLNYLILILSLVVRSNSSRQVLQGPSREFLLGFGSGFAESIPDSGLICQIP